jgi:hypothetical protein
MIMSSFYTKDNFHSLCVALTKKLQQDFQSTMSESMLQDVGRCMEFMNQRYPAPGPNPGQAYIDQMMQRTFYACYNVFQRQFQEQQAQRPAQHVPAVPNVPPRPVLSNTKDVSQTPEELNQRLADMISARDRDLPTPPAIQPVKPPTIQTSPTVIQEEYGEEKDDEYSERVIQQLMQQKQSNYEQRPPRPSNPTIPSRQSQHEPTHTITPSNNLPSNNIHPTTSSPNAADQRLRPETADQRLRPETADQRLRPEAAAGAAAGAVDVVTVPLTLSTLSRDTSRYPLPESWTPFQSKPKMSVYYTSPDLSQPSQIWIECIIAPMTPQTHPTLECSGIQFTGEIRQPYIFYTPLTNSPPIPFANFSLQLPSQPLLDKIFIMKAEPGAPLEAYAGMLHATRLFLTPYHEEYPHFITHPDIQPNDILYLNPTTPSLANESINYFNPGVELHMTEPHIYQLKYRSVILDKLEFIKTDVTHYLYILDQSDNSHFIPILSIQQHHILTDPTYDITSITSFRRIGWTHHNGTGPNSACTVLQTHYGTITPTPEIVERWGHKKFGAYYLRDIAQHIQWNDHDDIMIDPDWIDIDLPFEMLSETIGENTHYILQKKRQITILCKTTTN